MASRFTRLPESLPCQGVLHCSGIKRNFYITRRSAIIPVESPGQISKQGIPEADIYTFLPTKVKQAEYSINPGCVLVNNNLFSKPSNSNNLQILHSTSPHLAFALNENCDPTVRSDMIQGLQRIVKDDSPNLHEAISPSLAFTPQLGTWQGLYTITMHKTRTNAKVLTTELKPSSISTITISTSRGCTRIPMPKFITESTNGVLHAITMHTSCSLALLSHEESATREKKLSHTVPEKWNQEFFEHTYEGPDDMPAHLKCALQGAEANIAIVNGKPHDETLALYLVEHRDHRSNRKIRFSWFAL